MGQAGPCEGSLPLPRLLDAGDIASGAAETCSELVLVRQGFTLSQVQPWAATTKPASFLARER